jgi:hypothetical protein
VSIGNSCHSVDLEVLVRTDVRNTFNRSPVSERGLGIIEPIIAEMFEVMVVKMSNSLCNFTARNSTVKRQDLVSDLLGDFTWCLTCHEFVVEAVTTSENFDIIKIVRVDSGKANTAVVHLSSEDFVSEEIVTPDTAIRVSEVK